MKTEILKLLRESKDYVSGQQLCETFGVSRTAVWKVMNQLKEEGYEVEAVRNRGYRIVGSADVMTQEELESLLDGRTKWAGQHVVYSDEIDSTNIKAKQLGEEGASHGTLVVADMQTAGRGRRGRGQDELRQLWDKVLCCFDRAVVARETGDDAAIRDVYRIEDEVDDLEEELRDKHIKRLSDGKCLPSNGVVFLDILSNLERMSDHAKNIAECVQEEISSN